MKWFIFMLYARNFKKIKKKNYCEKLSRKYFNAVKFKNKNTVRLPKKN